MAGMNPAATVEILTALGWTAERAVLTTGAVRAWMRVEGRQESVRLTLCNLIILNSTTRHVRWNKHTDNNMITPITLLSFQHHRAI